MRSGNGMIGGPLAFFLLLGLLIHAGVAGTEAFEPKLLFADDFSSATVGRPPADWSVGANEGHLLVVEDFEAVGGKAVRISGDVRRATQMAVRLETRDPLIIVEHSVRWVKGFGLNYWLGYSLDGHYDKHNVNWFPDQNGNLAYRYTDEGRTKTEIIGPLKAGWNRVQLIVHLELKEAHVILNGTERRGPLPLWNVVDEWNEIRLTFYDTGRWAERTNISETESYYDDVRVSSVPAEQAASFYESIVRSDAESAYEAAEYGPIWIEYGDVATVPPGWGHQEANRALADRVVRQMQSGTYNIDVPVNLLTVPDGIFSTQLMALAQVYAATGDKRLKQAFHQGLNVLIEAQFPSGLWPTVFPNDRHQDLIKDKFAKASWESIPALFRAVMERRPPFDTDITEGIDPALLAKAIERIPKRELIREFSISDYAGRLPGWWTSDEAIRIGDNLISWQMDNGGWERVYGMAAIPFSPEKGHVWRGSPFGDGVERGDFLKGRTTEPLRFLARLYNETGETRFRDAFCRGLDFILNAQYPSGGWPRHYPIVGASPTAAPFNNAATFYNDAMVITLEFIQDVLAEEYPFGFVDRSYMPRLQAAFDKGIEFILKAQIEVDGRLTAWAQRHNPITYEPVAGRAFEPVAINPWVSVGIVKLLLSLPEPSPEVKYAVLSAVEYLERVRLEDGRWAMFYQLGTNRPIFAGRDAVIRYDLSEIELERQLGYAWYGTWPEVLLERVYADGVFEDFLDSLPDYPAVRVRLPLKPGGQQVSGSLPLNVELLPARQAAHVSRLEIDIDGQVVYAGSGLPGSGELAVNTEELDDGYHQLTVVTTHETLGMFSQTWTFNVANRWTLVQNMAPPVTEGWFPIDFLQTADRSEGWIYDTSDSDLFFKDPHRLLRQATTTEYLIWETPRLQTVSIILFVRPGIRIEEGIELAVAQSLGAWMPVSCAAELVEEGDRWHSMKITLDFTQATADQHWFRLTLTDALSHDGAQIGEVVLSGFNPR
jgi:PelA/Pel-15E family pectate lyase